MDNTERTKQWLVEGGGYCEKCKRESYCSDLHKKGGCRVRRTRLMKEGLIQQVKTFIQMGISDEVISKSINSQMLNKFNLTIARIRADMEKDDSLH